VAGEPARCDYTWVPETRRSIFENVAYRELRFRLGKLCGDNRPGSVSERALIQTQPIGSNNRRLASSMDGCLPSPGVVIQQS
jgi:hypothetical protein